MVWEPVLAIDRFAPTTGVLARISDARARQYWDRERRVSAAVGAAAGFEAGELVWDFVGVYPPGVRWEEPMDAPAWWDAPVVEAADELGSRLASLRGPPAGPS